MTTSLSTIRRITVEARESGVDKTTASLNKLSAAQANAAAVADTSARRAESAAAAYHRQSMTLDETVRAQVRVEKATRVADNAFKQGLITEAEHAARLDLIRTRLGGVASANDNVAKTTGLARHEMINLGRQMQDVGTMALMGMSPFAILSSQGAQVADIFMSTQGTVKGFFQQLTAGIASFLTPGRALVLGFTAASAAAYGLYSLLRTEQPTAEQSIKTQADLLGVLRDAYKDASKAAGEFYEQSKAITALQAQQGLLDAQRQVRDAASNIVRSSTRPTSVPSEIPLDNIAGVIQDAAVGATKFRELNAAVEAFNASAQGWADIKQYRDAVAAAGVAAAETNPELANVAAEIIKSTEAAGQAALRAEKYIAALAVMAGNATDAQRALVGLASSLKAVEQAQEANALALRSVTAFSPGAKAQIEYERSLSQYRKQGIEESKALELAEQRRTISLRQSQVAVSEANREREMGARQAVESAQLEVHLIGKTIGEQTRLRADLQARQQLEQEAARNRTLVNGKLSAEDEARLKRQKEENVELGKQADLRARIELARQIKFEADTLGLTDEDVQIATRLRDIYPDISTALSSAEAEQLRFNNRLREAKDYASDFANTFVQGLLQGKSVADAMVVSMDNLGQKLRDAGINNIIKDPTSAVGYIQTAVGIGIEIFTGQSQAAKQAAEDLEKSKQAWETMREDFGSFFKARPAEKADSGAPEAKNSTPAWSFKPSPANTGDWHDRRQYDRAA